MPVYKLNKKEFNLNKIIYVDSVNGNDNNTGDSEENAFKTHAKAISESIDKTGIVYAKGEYRLTNTLASNYPPNKELHFFGAGPECKIIATNDYSIYGEVKLYFYNLYFQETYYSGFMDLNSSKSIVKFYNCIFINTANAYYWITGNVDTKDNIVMSNCMIKTKSTNQIIYSNNYTFVNNGYFWENSYQISDQNYQITSLKAPTFDEFYRITSDGWKGTGTGINPDGSPADIGIYGGEYALYKIYNNENKILWRNPNILCITKSGNNYILKDSILKINNDVYEDLLEADIPVSINKRLFNIKNKESEKINEFYEKSILINKSDLNSRILNIVIE